MAVHRRSSKRRAGTAAVATVAVGVLAAAGIGSPASEIGGGRLIVVDAIDDEAQSFYEHYHFVPVTDASGVWS